MIQVGILGATGYTALELIKILLRHPKVETVSYTHLTLPTILLV